jgi:putative peptidoglycan lipid II flippase
MKLFKSTAMVSAMTLISRITGLLRESLTASFFGVNWMTDAFLLAFRIPNFMRRLFAEGSFALAFVPVLGQYKKQKSAEEMRAFVAMTAGTLGGILLIVVGVGILASKALVAVFAWGFLRDPAKFQLSSDLLRITMPFIFLVSMAGLAGGILNSFGRFATPAFAPVLLNLAMIFGILFISPHRQIPIEGLAWGVLLGGILQLVVQLPGLWKLGLLPRPKWGFRSDGVRQILRLMIPTLFGSSVAQVNLLVDSVIASMLMTGSVTWLYNADRLLEFPLGLFGVALGTVILPHLSGKHAGGDSDGFKRSIDWGLRVAAAIAIPAMVALVILAAPLLWALFAYHNFTARDVLMSTASLQMLSLGLPAFIASKVLAPGFYSRQDTRTPVRAGISSMVSNMLMNVIFVGAMLGLGYYAPHAGLALSSAAAGYINAGLLAYWLKRDGLLHLSVAFKKWTLHVFAAALGMGTLLWWCNAQFCAWPQWRASQRLLALAALSLAGAVTYAALLWIQGIRPRHLLDRG